jgi:hypothetical protein
MILGICLMQRDGTKCKGYEYYGHLLDPARCRGFVYNRPNDFIDQARDDFPCYFQLLEVVTTASRPHCPACRQYSTTPF